MIELMLVVAIIGLLASIALPKFAGLIVKAKEARVKAALGSMRSALAIYSADNDGSNLMEGCQFGFSGGASFGEDAYLAFHSDLTPKYIEEVPFATIPVRHDNRTKHSNAFEFANIVIESTMPSRSSSFAWVYEMPVNGITNKYDSPKGFYLNCNHTDSSGRLWSTW